MGESSLVVQWLGRGAFPAVAQVQSLIRELRSHKQHVEAGGWEGEAGGGETTKNQEEDPSFPSLKY